jgi:hypothetical protein
MDFDNGRREKIFLRGIVAAQRQLNSRQWFVKYERARSEVKKRLERDHALDMPAMRFYHFGTCMT